MENASKALIMAAGVLIGVLILSLAVYLYIDFGSSAAQINSQITQQQVVQFNSKFTSYEEQEGLTIYDVITVASYAYENNLYYKDNIDEYKIIVLLENTPIQDEIHNNKMGYIKNENLINGELPTYSCKVESYRSNGRIYKIKFSKN